MVRALLDSDASGLQRLLAKRVVYGLEGVGRPRAEVAERCVEETRALAYEPGMRAEDLIDFTAIEVQRVELFHTQTPLPPGVRGSDLLVTLPLHDAGTEHRPRIPCATAVYVRPGEQSAIVALSR